ncbi:hypothetical protein [Saccharomonospora piscinae]|uniref:DUF308 domain-containing protein n=1 Tax=Saccharomonospora piscinae TaxID=687388 RepID=A0A1V9AAA2_SACPI|nr:hypothetical protein [Saccharomonospora piscinae]OQO94052.1 hypothetical protein B1813_05990 [Saccharomonospora piscinae]TLW95225.1 hypothetical protein FFT09_05140 [Saccharomonospora piscinae]
MNRTSGPDGPEDVDATFAKIVADLQAEGFGTDTGRELDRDADTDGESGAEDDDGPASADGSRRRSSGSPREQDTATRSGWRDSGTDWDDSLLGKDAEAAFDALDSDDDEHFVPPEPPPLPRPRKGAVVVLLFFVVGLLLLLAPGLLGLGRTLSLPLGLLALATGIALALLRVRQGPPDGADPANGAQV